MRITVPKMHYFALIDVEKHLCRKFYWCRSVLDISAPGDEFTVAFFHFCDEFTVWRLHCDELYDWCLLYSTLASCRCAMSISCCCVLMAYMRRPILGWFFRYYFMSHFKAEMHQIRFRLGLSPRPSWGSLHLQHSPRPSGFKRLYF